MTANPALRHTCPGAHGGITAAECAAKGCCFSSIHCNISCPWCFTPKQEFGPAQFHNDADHWVTVAASDPLVTWYIQGWWGSMPESLRGHCSPRTANCECHCAVVNTSMRFQRQLNLPIGKLIRHARTHSVGKYQSCICYLFFEFKCRINCTRNRTHRFPDKSKRWMRWQQRARNAATGQ